MTIEDIKPKDEDTFDLEDLVNETSEELIKTRKQELSNKINKLFHKIDALSQQQRKEKQALKKTTDRLDKALALAEKLKGGDWSVVKELDKINEEEQQK